MNECPYIVGNECDIAKCEEFHVSRKEKIELLDKFVTRLKDYFVISHDVFVIEQMAEELKKEVEE